MISICVTIIDEPVLSKKCIESIQKHTSGDFEIVVCDNGSRDPGTISWLDALHARGEIKLSRNETNMGCGPAWNRSFRIAMANTRTEYVVTLHNDAEVIPGWVETLTAPLSDPIAGAKIGLVATERIGSCPEKRFIPGIIDRERQVAAGPIMVHKKSALDVVGTFDEQFVPIYYDDQDLMTRFRLAGFYTYIVLEKFPHVEFTTTCRKRTPAEVGQIVGVNGERFSRKFENTFLSMLHGWSYLDAPRERYTWVHVSGKRFVKVDRDNNSIVGEANCVAPYRVPSTECTQCSNRSCWKKSLAASELAFVADHGLPLVLDYDVDLRDGILEMCK